MKPICVPCRRFYQPKKNGVYFIEGMPEGGLDHQIQPGNAEPHNWKPYKLWMGDLWHCPDCQALIVVGTGLMPISEHYKPDFGDKLRAHGATYQVNDC